MSLETWEVKGVDGSVAQFFADECRIVDAALVFIKYTYPIGGGEGERIEFAAAPGRWATVQRIVLKMEKVA